MNASRLYYCYSTVSCRCIACSANRLRYSFSMLVKKFMDWAKFYCEMFI